jgi:hypothetical protein
MERPKKTTRPSSGLRLRSLEITDFKALDRLKLDLPAPRMARDPDVFVLGSRNGLGKTSVLEAVALVMLAARLSPRQRWELLRTHGAAEPGIEPHLDLTDLFIRSGAHESRIAARFENGGKERPVTLTLSRAESLELEPDRPLFRDETLRGEDLHPWAVPSLVDNLASVSPDPLILPGLLYFHSYRKVAEGATELGAWVDRRHRKHWRRPGDWPVSAFKLVLLGLLMRRADLFETRDDGQQDSVEALDQLNSIVETYAGGRIEKLLPAPENTIDFRIMPSAGGGSFSFDGLSSGQKEAISTLFLVWHHTRRAPGIILIDEPELHLNPEWQRDVLRRIHDLTPGSQLLVATHSEDVWGSVPEDRRIMLGD